VGPDSEDLLAALSVARDERSDRILVDLEADRFELPREVVEGVAVHLSVGIPPNRLIRKRVIGTGERLDVALDTLGAPPTVDGCHCAGL
jgi:hypothetical protein